MTKLKVGMIVIAPEITEDYLTPGKEYQIINLWGDIGNGFEIIDDEGFCLPCKLNNCAFLNGANWIIKPETTPQ